MKPINLKPFVVMLCLAGLLSQPTFARTINKEAELQQINQRAIYLEDEMNRLKKRLAKISPQGSSQDIPSQAEKHSHPHKNPFAEIHSHHVKAVSHGPAKHPRVKGESDNIVIPPSEVPDQIDPHVVGVSTKFESKEILEFGAMPVITSPYIGIQSRYDASNLVVNIPPYNDDVRLLKQRALMHIALAKRGLPMMVHPLVVLSGKIIGAVNWTKNYTHHQTSNINLNDIELDVTAHVNTWVTGLMVFNYDNTPLASGFVNSTANSRIFLNKGFVTVGDLDRSPFYGTLGQRFLPFGRYASASVSAPLITSIGSTLARSLLLGYQHFSDAGVYAGIYAFNGETRIFAVNNINRYGATLGYQYGNSLWVQDVDVGVDAINNISDAQGMQNTGASVATNQFSTAPGFTGFGATSATENLHRRVPGIDAHGKFVLFKRIVAHLEYLSAMRAFDPRDMTFNGLGARPHGMQAEADYLFRVVHRPASLALSYQKTWQALALNIPQERYLGAINISLLRNTIQSLEIHREVNYPSTATASGAGSAPFSPGGKMATRVLGRFGIYF